MFPNYHRKIRRVVAPFIFRRAHIPEIRLAIGAAERLAPVPLPLRRDHQVKTTKIVLDKIVRQEQQAHIGRGVQFSREDFPMTGDLGGGIKYV